MYRISLFVLLGMLICSEHVFAQSESGPQSLPVISQVGMVPVQWTGELSPAIGGMADLKQNVESAFSNAMRSSMRFQFINDDLVAEWWRSPKGREQLVKQFELNAFAGLSVIVKPDVVLFIARLMSPRLDNYLIETQSIERKRLEVIEKKEINERLGNLVYALINRLPVDVYITSVQGTYVTITGGKSQGINAGDQFDVLRSWVIAFHAANGSWLSFRTRKMGTIQIVDVRDTTSVAKLKTVTHENAIESGEGIKVDAMPGRVKFVRMAEKPKELAPVEDGSIIVPPFYPDKKLTKKTKNPVTAMPSEPEAPAQEIMATTPPPKQDSPSRPEEPPPAEGEESSFDIGLDGFVKKPIDDIVLLGGLNLWNASGPVSANNRFPLWILDKVGLRISRGIAYNFFTEFGGGLGFGTTKSGSYLAYDGLARLYYQDTVTSLGPMVSHWRGGAEGLASGISIDKERFGGGDWIKGGIFVGLSGNVLFISNGMNVDWLTEFSLLPLTVGQVGYSGKKRFIKSSMGMDFRFFGFLRAPPKTVTWGGGLVYSTHDILLENKKEFSIKTFDLMGAAKYQF